MLNEHGVSIFVLYFFVRHCVLRTNSLGFTKIPKRRSISKYLLYQLTKGIKHSFPVSETLL